MTDVTMYEAFAKLTKDHKKSAAMLNRRRGRYLVDLYYQTQAVRKTAQLQISALDRESKKNKTPIEPHELIDWVMDNHHLIETRIKSLMNVFSMEYTVGRWAQSIVGIGPIISAGLISEFDVRNVKTASRFFRYAGLDKTVKWEKKTKRPWNARLKRLCCFCIGESFVKVQNHKEDTYGQMYVIRKSYEQEKNEGHEYKEQAEEILSTRKLGKATEAYKWYTQGMLPPAHIHARARLYAVKMFISHLHHVMYDDYYKKQPPVPYVFSTHYEGNGDHRHYVPPPNWPQDFGGKSLKVLLNK